MRFHIITLGCKINQYESQALREAWLARGMTETNDPVAADFLLVNSCAVTARAIRDLRQTVRRLHRLAPEARIVVTGCAAEPLGRELQEMEGVSAVVPQKDKPLLRDPDAPPPGGAPVQPLTISQFQRSRAVLKVQDGCSHRCTYCIVPLTRGPAVSRTPGDILREARGLLENGLRELIISGINLRQYQSGEHDFWDLLAFLDRELSREWGETARLRCSSLDPAQLDERGLETIAACRMLCPHLHLSIQSASPTVLRRMGRSHNKPGMVARGVEQLQQYFPRLGVGADLLVGFPGESDEEFQETFDFVQTLPLTYAHVFPYSRRPGTPAAKFSDQVPKPVRTERAARLRELAKGKRLAFVQGLARLSRLRVLLESASPPGGRCEYYAMCRLEEPTSARAGNPGHVIVDVAPTGADGDILVVRSLEPRS